jgi:hypothetical protein
VAGEYVTKWRDKAKNRLLLGNIIAVPIPIVVVGRVWQIAQRYNPNILGNAADVRAALDFFRLFHTGYSELVLVFFALLAILFQIVATRTQLKNLTASHPHRFTSLFAILVIAVIVGTGLMIILFRYFSDVYLFLYLGVLGVGLPGFWPSYILYRRWEKNHQQTLLLQNWRLQIAK